LPFDGADGYRVACDAIASVFRPRATLGIAAWAAAKRILTGKSSHERGKWTNERIPFLRGIMDALEDSDPCELVVFAKSSQVGGSECGLNWIGRTIEEAPTPILALFPSEKDSRKWVRTRLQPMIATTPALRKLMPPNKRSDDGNTLQEKHFPDGVLYTGSANIPTDVASVSVAKVLLDEVDRMPATLEGEGDPVELAKRRTATFPRRKIFEVSTPTTEENSRIWGDWLLGTMSRYFVPCLHCNHRQALDFDNLTWPEDRPELACYRCESCATLIAEHEKTEMLAAGEWRMTYPERAAICKSFHINGLYTPAGLGDTWEQHARAWDLAKGKPAKEQVFYNTRRGEVVKGERIRIEWEAPYGRREPYKLRTIPPGVLILTGSADIQHDRIEAHILGHGRDERCVVIDHAVLEGDPTRPEVWRKLDDYLATELLNSFGVVMRLSCSLVDSGAWQHEVVNFTRERRARNIYAAKGSSIRTRPPIGRPSLIDVRHNGQLLKRGAQQYQIGVTVLKNTLYARLRSDAEALVGDRLIRFSDELPQEYFRQLVAEAFDPVHGWQKHYDHNEVLDLVVLGLAAAMHNSVGVHRYRELDWQRLEALYQPANAAARKEAAAAPPTLPGGRFLPTKAKVDNSGSDQ
jgi:phage terminase large subunit GpA-like protein